MYTMGLLELDKPLCIFPFLRKMIIAVLLAIV